MELFESAWSRVDGVPPPEKGVVDGKNVGAYTLVKQLGRGEFAVVHRNPSIFSGEAGEAPKALTATPRLPAKWIVVAPSTYVVAVAPTLKAVVRTTPDTDCELNSYAPTELDPLPASQPITASLPTMP